MASRDPMMLLGRDTELAALVSAVDRAVDGAGSVWLVHGEAGIGKTTLANAAIRHAAEHGAITAVATSWDHGGAPPFWPWARLLRSIVATHGRELEPSTASVTTRLAGTLRGSRQVAESDRLDLFDEVVTTLRVIAAERPVVILLDDLHAADLASLLLLWFVAQAIADVPVVVLGTYRPAELRARPELGDTAVAHLDEAARVGGSIKLGGLGILDVEMLAAGLLGERWTNGVAGRIHELTKGNPLFVRHLAPTVTTGEGADIDVPEGIRSAVQTRLRWVDGSERALLRLAALAGLEAEVDLVAALSPSELRSESRRPIADRLATSITLEFVEVDHETIRFTHPLVREVLADEIVMDERFGLHGQLAALCARNPGRDSLHEVAYHLLRAGPERAVEAARSCALAAESAFAGLAFEDAILHLHRGLEALDRVEAPAESLRLRFDLLVALGQACWRAGHRPECDEAFDAAWVVATELDDPEALARAAIGGGFNKAFSVVYPNERVDRVRSVLDLIGVEPGPTRSLLLSKLASELIGHPDPTLARSAAVEALEMAREVGEDRCIGEALGAVMATELGPDGGDRTSQADEMLAIARRCGDRAFAVQARFQLVGALVERGDRAALDSVIAEQHREVNELAEPGFLRHDVWFRAMLATVDGDIAAAEALIDEGLAAAALAHDPDGPLVWGGQLGVIRWMQGRVDELEPLYREMVASSSEPVWPAILAWLWARHGLGEAARGMLERIASRGLENVPRDRHWLLTMSTVAEASARVGAVDLAAEAHELLLPYHDRMIPIAMGISYWGAVARPLALVDSALGRPDVAIDRLESAVASTAVFGALPWMAEAQLDLAEVLLEHRPHAATERAAQLVAEASAVAERLGLVELAQRADRIAPRLEAVRKNRPGVSPDLDVTEESTVPPRIRVLGCFVCTDVDGHGIAWNSRKARAVLKLLVDARGARVTRDMLGEHLWPDVAPSLVSNRLSVAISTIRRSLDPRSVFSRSLFIGADRDTVWLDIAHVDVDLERFLDAASALLRWSEDSDSHTSAAEVVRRSQHAAAIYGGVPFADDPYDDWWSSTRHHVCSLFSELCHVTAKAALEAGLDATAAAALRAALDADTYDDRAHQALIALHRSRGADGLADLAEERRRTMLGYSTT